MEAQFLAGLPQNLVPASCPTPASALLGASVEELAEVGFLSVLLSPRRPDSERRFATGHIDFSPVSGLYDRGRLDA